MASKKSADGVAPPATKPAKKAAPPGRAETRDYTELEQLVEARVSQAVGPFFTTDVDPDLLWGSYLKNLPADRRQYYNCACCRRFVQKYGGLVTITADGRTVSVVWGGDEVPPFFAKAVAAMRQLVEAAAVTGVFLSSAAAWGDHVTGDWTHLYGCPAKPRTPSPVVSDEQAMSEKREEYRMLTRALVDYPKALVEQALGILKADALDRSEKTLGVAQWFADLHADLTGRRRSVARDNRVWAAVAATPPGFAHVRTSMIGTLLDDLRAKLPMAEVKAKWDAKMHPLRYLRPQAAPKAGAIEAAEQLVDKLDVTAALRRRYATLADLPPTAWVRDRRPTLPRAGASTTFAHLKGTAAEKSLRLPPAVLTWDKFARTVLPDVVEMQLLVPSGSAAFVGLTTAVDPAAVPILQWDGLPDSPRNPVAWYLYNGGSPASAWHLTANTWVDVTAACERPPHWYEPAKFARYSRGVVFVLAGCKDRSNNELCLFPETLRAELHGIRAVVEAHSKARKLEGDGGDASGLLLSTNTPAVQLMVRTKTDHRRITIDRVD